MIADFDAIVVGAGVVGLALGRELALSGRSVLVLERHRTIGEETSSRNSEVIHAGIYYAPGSLKARLCVRGRQLLYDYCRQRGVEHRRLGKLVVATEAQQRAALERLLERGRANGVTDLELLDRSGVVSREPALRACAGLWSPSTGVVDSHQLMLALQADLETCGGLLALASPLQAALPCKGGWRLQVGGADPAEVSCRLLVNCAGLRAQEVAAACRAPLPAPPRWLSKGVYFSLSGAAPFRHLVYPVPDEQGLGVHLTLDLQGGARFGPDSEWVSRVDYGVDSARRDDFVAAIRRYWPGLEAGRLQPGYAGIRPKVVGPGAPAGDFVIHTPAVAGGSGWVALYGIESPGLTAALAIAEYVRQRLAV